MAHSNLVQSLIRGLDMIEIVAGEERGLTLGELAGRLSLKTSTAHNLARTLAARRFVEKAGRPPRYRLGAAAIGLAEARARSSVLMSAEAVVVGLSRTLERTTVVFCESVGAQVVVRLRVSPERPNVLERPAGQVLHPYGSASALAFQAFWTEEERSEFRSRNAFWEFGGHLWRSERRLDGFLAEARAKGHASPVFAEKQALVVAAPVFGPGGDLLAVLGTATPATGLTARGRRKCVRETVNASVGLSRPG